MQRDFARAEEIDRIAWAFNPLEAGNAHFNLSRLGASARRFVANMYGERTDALNASVPTDRLIAEWHTTSERSVTVAPDATTTLPRLIQTIDQRDGLLTQLRVSQEVVMNEPRLLLEIPHDIATLRRDAPELAEEWRVVVGEAFRNAFEAGYRAVHFLRDESSGRRRGFYVLERL
jgi:predicted GNAT superfamily acetyltransferase